MAQTRFSIVDIFNIPDRDGIVVSGTVSEGEIRTGMTLQEETTRQPVRILAVDFPPHTGGRGNLAGVLLDRRTAAPIAKGTVLISQD